METEPGTDTNLGSVRWRMETEPEQLLAGNPHPPHPAACHSTSCHPPQPFPPGCTSHQNHTMLPQVLDEQLGQLPMQAPSSRLVVHSVDKVD
jgi:hypothetical protein